MREGAPEVKVTKRSSASRSPDRADSRSSRVLTHSREQLLQALTDAIPTLMDKVDDALFKLAEKADNNQDQSLYFEAMREVRRKRATMEATFVSELTAGIDKQLLDAKEFTSKSDEFLSLEPDELLLVGEEDLEESLAVTNMVTKVKNNCQEELFGLDRRIEALLGADSQDTGTNPFGPEVICESFRKACDEIEASLQIRLIVLKLFDRYVVSEVQRIYHELNLTLVRNGVLPDVRAGLGRARASESAGGRGHAATAAPEQATGPFAGYPAGQPQPGYPTGSYPPPGQFPTLTGSPAAAAGNPMSPGGNYPPGQFGAPGVAGTAAVAGSNGVAVAPGVAGFGGPALGAGVTLPAGWSATASGAGPEAMLHTLHGAMRGAGAGAGTAPALGVGAPIVSHLSALQQQSVELQANAVAANGTGAHSLVAPGQLVAQLDKSGVLDGLDQSDKVLIDVVSMMFDYILDDDAIPTSTRALIARLQIPVLKVALLDHTLFARKTHPVKRLLNTLAEASTGFSERSGWEDDLSSKIEAIVERIIDEFDEDVAIFSEVLEELEALLEGEQDQAEALAEAAAKEESKRERGEIAHRRVETELRRRLREEAVPDSIEQFVFKVWRTLLIKRFASDGGESEAWHSALSTLDDLIWSVLPKPDQDARKHLVKVLPSLVARLKVGMTDLGMAQDLRKGFLAHLSKLHLRAIKRSSSELAARAVKPKLSAINDEAPTPIVKLDNLAKVSKDESPALAESEANSIGIAQPEEMVKSGPIAAPSLEAKAQESTTKAAETAPESSSAVLATTACATAAPLQAATERGEDDSPADEPTISTAETAESSSTAPAPATAACETASPLQAATQRGEDDSPADEPTISTAETAESSSAAPATTACAAASATQWSEDESLADELGAIADHDTQTRDPAAAAPEAQEPSQEYCADELNELSTLGEAVTQPDQPPIRLTTVLGDFIEPAQLTTQNVPGSADEPTAATETADACEAPDVTVQRAAPATVTWHGSEDPESDLSDSNLSVDDPEPEPRYEVQVSSAALAELDDEPSVDHDALARVAMSVDQANSAVFQTSNARPQCKGMGTTVVAVCLGDNKLTVGHVGDSRLYRLRKDCLELLTLDHSLRQEMVNRGVYTPEQAQKKIASNIVSRAIGTDDEVEVEVAQHDCDEGDLYLLCSDGLSDMVAERTLAYLLEDSQSLEDTAQLLIDAANSAGGKDNITVGLIAIDHRFGPGESLLGQVRMTVLSDVGKRRAHNEDRVSCELPTGLMVLADGMGGCNAGEVASGMTVEIVMRELGASETVLASLSSESNVIEETVTKVEAEQIDTSKPAGAETTAKQPDDINFTAINALFWEDNWATPTESDESQVAESAATPGEASLDLGDLSMFADSGAADVQEIVATSAESVQPGPHGDSNDCFIRMVDDLQLGGWVEFRREGESSIRGRLSWISKDTGRYFFTDRKGAKVTDATALGLAVEFRRGTAKRVEKIRLFDRALGKLTAQLGA